MSWLGIEGHDEIAALFRRSIARGRLAHTYLFLGPQGIGKRTFAERLAQSLLCSELPPGELSPCGECDACRQVLAGTHPDLLRVSKPPDKNVLPIELFVGPRERRMQTGLCHDIALKPFMGGRRVAIIDDADDLNPEAANSLLKTLEEPPPHSAMILIATNEESVLPTIRSRSQIMRFRPLETGTVADLLQSQGVAESREEAQRLAASSGGSVGTAIALADPELWEFRATLVEALSSPVLQSVHLVSETSAFIDRAGREAVARRDRGRQIVMFAIEFYREQMRRICGAGDSPGGGRASLPPDFDATWAADCAERCLEALEHIDRYAHQAAWLECWLDDLARRYAAVQATVA